MNAPHRLLSIDEIKAIANGQVKSLCAHLLPNGQENCGYWEVGSIAGEKGQSLKVNLTGSHRGMWTDFSAAKGSPQRAGNIVQLVAQVEFGGDVGRAIQFLKSWLGLDGLDPGRLERKKAAAVKRDEDDRKQAAEKAERNRRAAHGIYLSAQALPGTPAETYLCSRGIDLRGAGLASPGALKFHAQVFCREAGKKIPAMVAAVTNLKGEHIATHRTYLAPDGKGKALLTEAKKALGKFTGGFIPLWKGEHDCSMRNLPIGTPIYVSEGIEDGLSVAMARPSLRIIAAISLSNLGNLELPVSSPVYILGQRDEKLQALDAFEKAVTTLQAKGHQVFLIYPPDGVKDYNDLVRPRAVKGGN